MTGGISELGSGLGIWGACPGGVPEGETDGEGPSPLR